jgi:hypothetical protein
MFLDLGLARKLTSPAMSSGVYADLSGKRLLEMIPEDAAFANLCPFHG